MKEEGDQLEIKEDENMPTSQEQESQGIEIERFEADTEQWIEDHTGVKRKAFGQMIKEVKRIIKGKIVILHNLAQDFAYLRLTRHDCARTIDTSLLKMFQKKSLKRKLKDLILQYVDVQI